MQVVHGLEALEPLKRSVLTIGNFDGVHLGHRKLIGEAAALARAYARSSSAPVPVAVLTFEPHPLTVVAPEKAPQRLATMNQKLHDLDRAGADLVVIAESTPELLGLEAEAFVEHVIVGRFQVAHVVEGPSFGFGRGRRGTPELLSRLGKQHGFGVRIVEPVMVTSEDGEGREMVSSSLIRRLVASGAVEGAAESLGRRYELEGWVGIGDRRGRRLGFPTANVIEIEQILPGEGVYSGTATVDDETFAAAINVGRVPTFGVDEVRVETHLLDFDGDIYDRPVCVAFHSKLRDQQRFAGPDELAAQIARDVTAVRATINGTHYAQATAS